MNIHLYMMVFQKQCDHTKMMWRYNSYLAVLVDLRCTSAQIWTELCKHIVQLVVIQVYIQNKNAKTYKLTEWNRTNAKNNSTPTCKRTRATTHTCAHAVTHALTLTHTRTPTHTQWHTQTYTHTGTRTRPRIHIHVHTHTHALTRMHTHAHTHTHS